MQSLKIAHCQFISPDTVRKKTIYSFQVATYSSQQKWSDAKIFFMQIKGNFYCLLVNYLSSFLPISEKSFLVTCRVNLKYFFRSLRVVWATIPLTTDSEKSLNKLGNLLVIKELENFPKNGFFYHNYPSFSKKFLYSPEQKN